MKITPVGRVHLYLAKMYKVSLVDTQKIRAKLVHQLNSVFELAVAIAKGEMKQWTDENGKKHPVTPKQREKWARIAAYSAQVMSSLTRGFDEKQFQLDVKKLEKMVDEVRRQQAEEASRKNIPGRV
jgi:hypothetical protein